MAKSAPLDVKNQIDRPLVVKRGRGRPKKADALTNAERQRRWRQKTVTVKADVLEAALSRSVSQESNLTETRALESDRVNALLDELKALKDAAAYALVYATETHTASAPALRALRKLQSLVHA